jgi:hypothetical protein
MDQYLETILAQAATAIAKLAVPPEGIANAPAAPGASGTCTAVVVFIYGSGDEGIAPTTVPIIPVVVPATPPVTSTTQSGSLKNAQHHVSVPPHLRGHSTPPKAIPNPPKNHAAPAKQPAGPGPAKKSTRPAKQSTRPVKQSSTQRVQRGAPIRAPPPGAWGNFHAVIKENDESVATKIKELEKEFEGKEVVINETHQP